ITVRQVAGLKDLKQVPTLNAYPNPTRGETTITLTQAAGEQYKIRISNAIGRTIKTVDLKDRDLENGVQLDLTGLPAGFYFYSLLANDKMIETKRLVIQR
ncbi:MAG TPA: T9SS type A sorting domain-containing protein, partial [Adhaeribacter sp.]|nr:T9SS type A sorting domain-containing protein [Adhaeribacter sp.]